MAGEGCDIEWVAKEIAPICKQSWIDILAIIEVFLACLDDNGFDVTIRLR